jgi:hypothetical protein
VGRHLRRRAKAWDRPVISLSPLFASKTQLDAISRRVSNEYLGDPQHRHLTCPEFDIVAIEACFHGGKISAGKGDMIESGWDIGMPHFVGPGSTQVKYALIPGIKPIPKASKGRTRSFGQTYDLNVECSQFIEQGPWSA